MLKFAIVLFVAWLIGVLLAAGAFIHILLLTAIAFALIAVTHNRRCGKPLLSLK